MDLCEESLSIYLQSLEQNTRLFRLSHAIMYQQCRSRNKWPKCKNHPLLYWIIVKNLVMYFNFSSFVDMEKLQIVVIHPRGRHEYSHCTLPMALWCKASGYQQPRYWSSLPGICRFQHWPRQYHMTYECLWNYHRLCFWDWSYHTSWHFQCIYSRNS